MYKISMVSLGCPKNQVDAEMMLSLLKQGGFEICSEEAEADAIIINTCGFIEEAKKEFGDTGRIVVRPSGTEPLIRVMTEGEDRVLTESIAKRVSEVIQDRLSGK